jgi:hypothetical protein
MLKKFAGTRKAGLMTGDRVTEQSPLHLRQNNLFPKNMDVGTWLLQRLLQEDTRAVSAGRLLDQYWGLHIHSKKLGGRSDYWAGHRKSN